MTTEAGTTTTKTCSASAAVALECCGVASGSWHTSSEACTITIDNDVFKHCVMNKSGERITCDLSAKATGSGNHASALRIGRAAALAVGASLLLAVMSAVW
jgi:hypothetical protein